MLQRAIVIPMTQKKILAAATILLQATVSQILVYTTQLHPFGWSRGRVLV